MTALLVGHEVCTFVAPLPFAPIKREPTLKFEHGVAVQAAALA